MPDPPPAAPGCPSVIIAGRERLMPCGRGGAGGSEVGGRTACRCKRENPKERESPGIRAIAPLLQAQEPASAVSRRGLHPPREGAAVRHAEPCVPRCRRWSIRSRRVAGLPVRAKNPKEPESRRNRGDCAVATGQTNLPQRFRDVACMPRAGTGGGRTDPVCRERPALVEPSGEQPSRSGTVARGVTQASPRLGAGPKPRPSVRRDRGARWRRRRPRAPG
jgi:hypothetical protein